MKTPKIKLRTSILLILASLISGTVWADSVRNFPRSWVTTSENNTYSFTMLPGVGESKPRGFAVKHLRGGASSLHWATSGWYGFNGHITSDGKYLITHADHQILVDRSDVENIEVLRFQNKDKLLKAYTLGELVDEIDDLRWSVSHTYWLAQGYGARPYGLKGNDFTLITAEKNRFVFDIRDGSISSVERADDIKTHQEIEQTKEQEALESGRELYYSSDIGTEFDNAFSISEMNSLNGSISGVHFLGQQWTANLSPLDDSLKDCKVRAVFPRQGNKRLFVSVTADEIIQSCRSVLSNSYIRDRFGSDRLDVRIRVTGDRLNWDSDELLKRLSEADRQLDRGKIPIYWAEVIITTNNPDRQYFKFFLHTQTGDIVFGDTDTKFPYSSVYIQAGQ